MRSKLAIIKNRRTVVVISLTAIITMVLMPFLVKPAMADNGENAEVCSPETVPDTSGKADYVYKLNTDCTLHIGPTNIPSRNEPSPIQQHDKVRRIVFDDPEKTSLDEYSSYLFYGYPNVRSIEGLDKLDVSHVMQFTNTFAGLNLEEPVDLSSWNVSTAWNFQSMFQGSNLDGFKGIDKFTFNLSNKVQWYAKDFQLMFKDTTSTKGIDLSGWTFLNPNESNGVIFGSMFDGAKTPKIDVSSFSDLDIGAGAMGMFANTNTDIRGLDKFPTQSVMDTSRMFENAKPTNQIDLSSWNTKNLYNAESMFNGSDIDKFIGLDKWNLSSLTNARAMYANLHPSYPVHIQTNLPNLNMGSGMFSGTDIDMFPNIDKMQLSTNGRMPEMMFDGMFENSTATYLNMSKWTNAPRTGIWGMLASPNIKYATFGNKTVGSDYSSDFIINSGPGLFSGRSQDPNAFQSVNVWDRTDLPKEYSAKKWATLPIKPDCDAQFDGHPDHLSKNCWDDSQSWVSEKTGEEADEELMDNITKHYQRIFFRVESIPVGFHSNGVENATSIPDMKYFMKTFTSKDDLIPNTVPEDPSGVKVFASWNTQADGKGKTYHPGDHMGHDITSIDLYAQWKTNNHSINFIDMSKENDNLPDNAIVSHGSNYTIPNQIPRRYGYTFDGWSTEDGGEVRYQPGDVLKITSDVNLYAQWKINNYSIRFIDPSNESKDLPDKATSIFGSNYTIPNRIPTRPGYSFVGWATENGGQVKYQPGDVLFMEEDIVLYATWAKKAPAIQFNNNGGEGATPETKPTDDNTKIVVDCANTPSKDGATFIGWSKTKNDVLEDSEAGEKGKIVVCGYSGKKTLTGLQGRTIDLYATWAKKPQAVFNENRPDGMTVLLPETKTITGDWHVDDSTPRTYVAPSIDGWYKGYSPDGVWQFDGWVNEDGSPFTGTYLERNDLVINAKWSKIKSADVPSHDNEQNHDDNNNQDNKPSGDDSIDDSNSDNQNNNGDNTVHKDPSSEEKPSAPENKPVSDGISSISNSNSNQMIVSNSDSEDSPDVGDSEAAVSSNETAVNDTFNEEKGSQLAKTGVSLIFPIVIIVVSVVFLIIARRLRNKA